MSFHQPPDDLPQGLFSERPVRSDFSRRGLSYAARRRITVGILLVLVCSGMAWGYHSYRQAHPAEIPTIKAEGSYRQRPQEPGGLDIPHQDVEVYQELDKNTSAAAPPIEHLLPPPEMPQIPAQAVPEAHPAKIESLAPGLVPPPVTASSKTVTAPAVESLPPVKSSTDFVDVLGEKTPPAPVATTVMPVTKAITTAVPAPVPSPVTKAADAMPAVPLAGSPPAHTPTAKAPPPRTIEQVLHDVGASSPTAASGVATNSGTVSQQAHVAQQADAAPEDITQADDAASSDDGSTQGATDNGPKDSGVQLASLPDRTGAEETMQNLQKKYAVALQNVSLHVVKADLGAKGVYYRVESAPISGDRAHRICAALKNLNAGCILVKH